MGRCDFARPALRRAAIRRAAWTPVALWAVIALLLAPAAGAARRPNIIVIQTDDQVAADLTPRVMPNTEKYIAGPGTTFEHYDVATPQCCPSRASLFTGQYPHNDGITANGPGYSDLREKYQVLPVWLRRAGYHTVHVGKFINGYSQFVGSVGTPTPGWDEWYSVGTNNDGSLTSYYGYDLGVNGHTVHEGDRPRNYVTRVFERRALTSIKRHADAERPLYLQLDERAPHIAGAGYRPPGTCGRAHRPIPDPLDMNAFHHVRLPKQPSFNEADVSDKPTFIRRQPRFSAPVKRRIILDYRCRLATLRGVDRTVGRIHGALVKAHAVGNTVLVFLSDNGFFDGQHRIRIGKVLPYTEALRQPLLIDVPPAYRAGDAHRSVSTEASNVDIAPTILNLAHATPCIGSGTCRTQDGRSLLPLLSGSQPGWAKGRAVLTEFANEAPAEGVCAYSGVITPAQSYVQYTSADTVGNDTCVADDERELYDLRRDPFELRNEYPPVANSAAATKLLHLEQMRMRLADCSGIKGRDPEPASGHYCD